MMRTHLFAAALTLLSADVLVMRDGALLVSDDLADTIYRITYSRT